MKFIVLFIFLTSFSFGDDSKDGWIVVSKRDDITIYTKESKGSAIRSMRAQGVIDAPVDKVTSILRDVKSAKDWVPNLIERSYIENISDTEAILYEITDMPWPVDDRDITVHHKLTLSEDKKSLILYFKSVERKDKPVQDGMVRAQFHFGKIYFTPQGNKTYMELVLLVDPMGNIPKWAVNILQFSMPYDFLMALRKFANKTEIKTLPGIQHLISQLEQPSENNKTPATARSVK